ncbi:D-alanine transaminase [Burkholderiales bacterium 8X]|nr:D-alanine transaminase [Burkholderiales bacterium 8X]
MHPIPSALPDTPCYLNGNYGPLGEAKISVLDRGFIFGDGVYEVVPVYGGVPFCFEEHMARLDRSLAELKIANPLSHEDWLAIAARLIEASPPAERAAMQGVYIQVTRGVAPRDHAMPPGLVPTVFLMVNPIKPVSAEARARGVYCVSAPDFRWQKAHIKATSLLGAVLARQISVEAGAFETIMFRDDWLSEASSCNVWIVKNGRVFGPPRDTLVLAGIRFNIIERLCDAAGIPFDLRRIGRDEVFGADEVFLSSASKELVPVTKLDEETIGEGMPGPVCQALFAGYQEAKASQAAQAGSPSTPAEARAVTR